MATNDRDMPELRDKFIWALPYPYLEYDGRYGQAKYKAEMNGLKNADLQKYVRYDLYEALLKPAPAAQGDVAHAIAFFDDENEAGLYADGTTLGANAIHYIDVLVKAAKPHPAPVTEPREKFKACGCPVDGPNICVQCDVRARS